MQVVTSLNVFKFDIILQAKECSKEFKRNQFQDILIRPVQRLPTVVVLLKELQKRDITKSEKVDKAIALVEKIIRFKYFTHVLIPSVREINRMKLSYYEDTLPIFCWTIRDVTSDATWYVEAIERDPMTAFVDEIHEKIFMDLGRDVSWGGFMLSDVHCSNLREMLKKHMKKALAKDAKEAKDRDCFDVTQAAAADPSSSQSFAKGLRRTVSQVGGSFVRLAIPQALRRRSTSTTRIAGEGTVPEQQPLSQSQCETHRRRSRIGVSSIELKEEFMSTVIEEQERDASDKEN
ncbi:hypothetical protein OESDEN_05352 [Oesophagostomum dentatum]|uniref:DH domain-containing protein n=1 Tax=Oesophagostomum dentatum TaxID=61180 RepID=A0A0B1TFX9_OESDE|nr:hypothetical protein OESDEN_05352 [Oesophagostomum dentatum]